KAILTWKSAPALKISSNSSGWTLYGASPHAPCRTKLMSGGSVSSAASSCNFDPCIPSRSAHDIMQKNLPHAADEACFRRCQRRHSKGFHASRIQTMEYQPATYFFIVNRY